jgi:hypothetical protein
MYQGEGTGACIARLISAFNRNRRCRRPAGAITP